jgi:CRP-like cAMP-binding protein
MNFIDCNNCNIKSVLVKQLDSVETGKLVEKCTEVNYKKGDVIFKEGVFTSNIVYLKKGLVKLHISSKENEFIAKIIKAPSFIGIPTTLNEKINHYSATAIEPTVACIINLDIFKYFIHENHKYAYEIIKELCKNELESFHRCVKRSHQNVRGRIADALLFFSNEIYENKTFNMPISRIELGYYTDTSRESVCRVLNEFSKDNLIKVKGKKIEIINEKILHAIRENG